MKEMGEGGGGKEKGKEREGGEGKGRGWGVDVGVGMGVENRLEDEGERVKGKRKGVGVERTVGWLGEVVDGGGVGEVMLWGVVTGETVSFRLNCLARVFFCFVFVFGFVFGFVICICICISLFLRKIISTDPRKKCKRCCFWWIWIWRTSTKKNSSP